MGSMVLEFPCGMCIKTKSFYHYFNDKDLNKLYVNGCPLHGKNCPMPRDEEVPEEEPAVDETAPTTEEEPKEEEQ